MGDNNNKVRLASIKQLNKMNKGEAYDTVLTELPDLVRYYFRFAVIRRDEQQALFERMKDKKNYARYIKHALKEDDNPFPDGFNFILSEFLQRFAGEAQNDDELAEVCGIYSEVLEKICKRRAKNIGKSLGLPKDIAMEIAIIFPGRVLSRHNAWVFNRALTYRLTRLQAKCWVDTVEEAAEKTTDDKVEERKDEVKTLVKDAEDLTFSKFDLADPKFLKKLYKGFFGDDEEVLERVYGNMMLDRANMTSHFTSAQKRLWDAQTALMLKGIEKLSIKTVKRIAAYYSSRRDHDAKRDNDPQRRIVISKLEYEDAPKLVTVFNPDNYEYKDALKKGKKKDKKGKKKDKKKKKH
jgi:hypothetical protein